MANLADILTQAMLNSGLAQYPDAKLYNAAKLLLPEERPIVPVEMAQDDWRTKQGVEAQYFGEINKYNPDRQRITVQRKGDPYKKFEKQPHRLAGILAHEAEHSKRNDPFEAPAYRKHKEVLLRLGEKDKGFLTAMDAAIARHEGLDEEQRVKMAKKAAIEQTAKAPLPLLPVPRSPLQAAFAR